MARSQRSPSSSPFGPALPHQPATGVPHQPGLPQRNGCQPSQPGPQPGSLRLCATTAERRATTFGIARNSVKAKFACVGVGVGVVNGGDDDVDEDDGDQCLEEMCSEYMVAQLVCEEDMGGEGLNDVIVGGLAQHVSFWERIGASGMILAVIRNGYVLPFSSRPSTKILPNHESAIQHAGFVETEVVNMLRLGCVREAKEPVVCSPLGVVDNGKKTKIDR